MEKLIPANIDEIKSKYSDKKFYQRGVIRFINKEIKNNVLFQQVDYAAITSFEKIGLGYSVKFEMLTGNNIGKIFRSTTTYDEDFYNLKFYENDKTWKASVSDGLFIYFKDQCKYIGGGMYWVEEVDENKGDVFTYNEILEKRESANAYYKRYWKNKVRFKTDFKADEQIPIEENYLGRELEKSYPKDSVIILSDKKTDEIVFGTFVREGAYYDDYALNMYGRAALLFLTGRYQNLMFQVDFDLEKEINSININDFVSEEINKDAISKILETLKKTPDKPIEMVLLEELKQKAEYLNTKGISID